MVCLLVSDVSFLDACVADAVNIVNPHTSLPVSLPPPYPLLPLPSFDTRRLIVNSA
jgi:hypothetical protein